MTASTLEQKRKQLIKQLQSLDADMLRGSLIKRYRRCGKSNCHCAQEQGHESYYLSVSMPGRNPIMVYVSFKNQDKVKKALANYQTAQSILEDISTLNREALVQKEIL
ncbi:MAG: hypothetical protein K2Y18_00625 [Alphaproteobacteria bacterium]|nr:hypothetical protein [Alphaproteobacteria bacterium]